MFHILIKRRQKAFQKYTHSQSFSRFLGLIFVQEKTPEKALNILDIRDFSRIVSEQNICPKNLENDRK